MSASKPYQSKDFYYSISGLEAMTLAVNVAMGAQNPKVGFEDTFNTYKYILSKLLNFRIKVRGDILESALWASNLLHEEEAFWSPNNEKFDHFINRFCLEHKLVFDKFYNTIEPKRKVTK